MSAAWAAISAVVLIAFVLCLLCLRMRRLRKENRQLRQALEDCQARFQALDGQLGTLRELRHDLRHYLQASGAPLPASLENLLHSPSANSDIISGLLERSRSQVEKSGASADIRLDLPPLPDSMLPDLYLILSNLLENAAEALAREGGGWLRLRSTAAPGYLSVVVGNSCKTELKTVGGRYLSSKSPGRLGLGLETVRRVARQYGGDAVFTSDGQEFRACVFLTVSTTPAEHDIAPDDDNAEAQK